MQSVRELATFDILNITKEPNIEKSLKVLFNEFQELKKQLFPAPQPKKIDRNSGRKFASDSSLPMYVKPEELSKEELKKKYKLLIKMLEALANLQINLARHGHNYDLQIYQEFVNIFDLLGRKTDFMDSLMKYLLLAIDKKNNEKHDDTNTKKLLKLKLTLAVLKIEPSLYSPFLIIWLAHVANAISKVSLSKAKSDSNFPELPIDCHMYIGLMADQSLRECVQTNLTLESNKTLSECIRKKSLSVQLSEVINMGLELHAFMTNNRDSSKQPSPRNSRRMTMMRATSVKEMRGPEKITTNSRTTSSGKLSSKTSKSSFFSSFGKKTSNNNNNNNNVSGSNTNNNRHSLAADSTAVNRTAVMEELTSSLKLEDVDYQAQELFRKILFILQDPIFLEKKTKKVMALEEYLLQLMCFAIQAILNEKSLIVQNANREKQKEIHELIQEISTKVAFSNLSREYSEKLTTMGKKDTVEFEEAMLNPNGYFDSAQTENANNNNTKSEYIRRFGRLGNGNSTVYRYTRTNSKTGVEASVIVRGTEVLPYHLKNNCSPAHLQKSLETAMLSSHPELVHMYKVFPGFHQPLEEYSAEGPIYRIYQITDAIYPGENFSALCEELINKIQDANSRLEDRESARNTLQAYLLYISKQVLIFMEKLNGQGRAFLDLKLENLLLHLIRGLVITKIGDGKSVSPNTNARIRRCDDYKVETTRGWFTENAEERTPEGRFVKLDVLFLENFAISIYNALVSKKIDFSDSAKAYPCLRSLLPGSTENISDSLQEEISFMFENDLGKALQKIYEQILVNIPNIGIQNAPNPVSYRELIAMFDAAIAKFGLEAIVSQYFEMYLKTKAEAQALARTQSTQQQLQANVQSVDKDNNNIVIISTSIAESFEVEQAATGEELGKLLVNLSIFDKSSKADPTISPQTESPVETRSRTQSQ